MNTDGCAWCGTGDSICDEHMQALLAESKALAATGQYLARDGEKNTQTQAKPTESEAKSDAAA